MKYTLFIKGDVNDADYVQQETVIEKEELELIRKVCGVLTGHYNWFLNTYPTDKRHPRIQYADILTQGEIDIFDGYLPYHDPGIHSVVEVKVAPLVEWKQIYRGR